MAYALAGQHPRAGERHRAHDAVLRGAGRSAPAICRPSCMRALPVSRARRARAARRGTRAVALPAGSRGRCRRGPRPSARSRRRCGGDGAGRARADPARARRDRRQRHPGGAQAQDLAQEPADQDEGAGAARPGVRGRSAGRARNPCYRRRLPPPARATELNATSRWPALAGCGWRAPRRSPRVVSGSQKPGQTFRARADVGWSHESRRRRSGGRCRGSRPGGRSGFVKDLVYRQTRNVLDLRADVGVFKDLSLFLASRWCWRRTFAGLRSPRLRGGRCRRGASTRTAPRSCATGSCRARGSRVSAWTRITGGRSSDHPQGVPGAQPKGARVPGDRGPLGDPQPATRLDEADLAPAVRAALRARRGHALRPG